ncbi:PTS sugar transporter subunit IIA [uncultured Ilyobacter sp.]|uniref:PTS sugar transporter subunit IIA n=1 Tax=uncultured Ilyobacter sp. TaxID=544433 RepID=UPI0029C08485|nr:PTS sugar transporter subunit IIA [uncultured Ilyobacter sp.]
MLQELIKKENIVFLDEENPRNAIKLLVKKAKELEKLGDQDLFETEIFEREAILSTGIGLGIAIPHAKLEGIEKIFIIVGINRRELDWDSIDEKPVKIVFLIGAPESDQKNYLRILSKLILLVKNEVRREAIFSANQSQEVVELFKNF